MHRRGKLLLVKRGQLPDKGKWSFPGGAVELGETTEEAAIREVKEETGLDIELQGLFDVATYLPSERGPKARNKVIVLDYLGRPRSGRVKLNRESTAFGWFTPEEVQRLDTTRSIRLFAARFGRMSRR